MHNSNNSNNNNKQNFVLRLKLIVKLVAPDRLRTGNLFSPLLHGLETFFHPYSCISAHIFSNLCQELSQFSPLMYSWAHQMSRTSASHQPSCRTLCQQWCCVQYAAWWAACRFQLQMIVLEQWHTENGWYSVPEDLLLCTSATAHNITTHWTRLKPDVTSWFTQRLQVEGIIQPVWRIFLIVELV